MNVEELIDDWDSIRQGYFLGEDDETLLACVEELQAVAALSAVASDPAVAHSAGDHETHPYDSEFSGNFGAGFARSAATAIGPRPGED
ncbi:hypothetical protein GCM10017771_48440 [Streptomyces capitiformicae]|uniref:Uncharacterized protein n=1 Tax=Streptomyces capitiformicae TaxID=2014920 RepID=A0A919DBJ6_9ACTN|nr:hypothetical protein GCM10017771_48440 [Streptomyces capitiformicae]